MRRNSNRNLFGAVKDYPGLQQDEKFVFQSTNFDLECYFPKDVEKRSGPLVLPKNFGAIGETNIIQDDWMSPSDEVVRHLILRGPLQRRRQHEAELEEECVAEEVETFALTKSEYEIRRRIQKAADERETRILGILRAVVKRIKEEEEEKYNELFVEEVVKLKLRVEEKLNAAVARIRENECRKKDLAIGQVKEAMEEELKRAMSHQMKFLEAQYQFHLSINKNLTYEEYQNKLRKNSALMTERFEKFKEETAIGLEKCKNTIVAEAEGVYFQELCQMKKINVDKELRMKKLHELDVDKYESMLNEKKLMILQLEDQIAMKNADIKAWKCITKLLLKQFQKFINFSMKCTPGHADFLLSLDEIARMKSKKMSEKLAEMKARKYRAIEEYEKVDLIDIPTERSESDIKEFVQRIKKKFSLSSEETLQRDKRDLEREAKAILLEIINKIVDEVMIRRDAEDEDLPKIDLTDCKDGKGSTNLDEGGEGALCKATSTTYGWAHEGQNFQSVLSRAHEGQNFQSVLSKGELIVDSQARREPSVCLIQNKVEDTESSVSDVTQFVDDRVASLTEIFKQYPSLTNLILPQ